MARTPCFTPHQKRPRAHIARGHLAGATIGQGQFHPAAVWCDLKHRRLGAVRDPLVIVRAARLFVQGDAGLVRALERDLVTHHGGEDEGSCAEQAHETQEQNGEQWATDGTTDRPVNDGMFSLWRAV